MTSELLSQALILIFSENTGTSELALNDIVRLSLAVAFSSSLIAAAIGIPLGVTIATKRFVGKPLLIGLVNTSLGLPSVIIGLIAYLLLSRAGPLGHMGLLFSPSAMVIAQSMLITPMVAALTIPIVERSWFGYRELFLSLRATGWQSIKYLIIDCRYILTSVYLTALGRALAEVGAVMTVGGNIAGQTRVITTAIALETSKGDLTLALALGIILLGLVFTIMLTAQLITHKAGKRFES